MAIDKCHLNGGSLIMHSRSGKFAGVEFVGLAEVMSHWHMVRWVGKNKHPMKLRIILQVAGFVDLCLLRKLYLTYSILLFDNKYCLADLWWKWLWWLPLHHWRIGSDFIFIAYNVTDSDVPVSKNQCDFD